jgi:HK97 family phage prohead protease
MPKVTKRHIRIPVRRKKKDDIIRTITISQEEGIKALYSANRKLVLTYIFIKSKGWTLEKAKRWVEQNKSNKESMEKQKFAYVEKTDGKIKAVASDETEDRHGDVVKVSGWKVENFLKNPVLQWAHDPTTPAVGKAEDIKVEGKKLTFKPVFSKATQLAKDIKKLYEEGILKAFSVGYRELDRNDKAETVEQELLEISCVNVPSNPNALLMAKSKGLNTDLISDPYIKREDLDSIKKDIKTLAKGMKILTKPEKGRDSEAKEDAKSDLQLLRSIDKQLEVVIKKKKNEIKRKLK